jgi:ribonuclease III
VSSRIAAVQAAFGHAFCDERLVSRALRHASVGGVDGSDNERLEFLGDACIGLAVATDLYERHAQAPEGELTERRARAVSRGHLARVARRLGLEPILELRPPLTPGTRVPDSILAGAFEALIGAVYLDAGFEVARRIARELLLGAVEPEARANRKAALQHQSQVRFGCVPSYRLLEDRLHAFGRTFCVVAEIAGRQFAPGWGRNKREAEQEAAREALVELAQENGSADSS